MKLLNFTIIKFTSCLILGILIGYYCPISVNTSIAISAFFLLTTSILFLKFKSKHTRSIWFGLLSFISMISLGVLVENLKDAKYFKSHYIQSATIGKKTESIIQLKIKERLKPNLYSDKYVAKILKIGKTDVMGKVLLNIQKDSSNLNLKVGDLLLVSANFDKVNSSLNPGQFDYGNYLERQYIYHQISVASTEIYRLKSNDNSAFGFAGKLRDRITTKLSTYNFKSNELAIINALLLGQRQDMDKTVYQDFINAGAVHILAVSGLHIGIILLILNVLLNPLKRIKNGSIVKTIILVALLWIYAIIAGLSASITRAVAMFSIVAIAMNMKRPTNIYNTLAISVFVILLIKPMFLFEVGFQLSYVAVIAIVTIQPMLYKIWQPKWKVIDYLWQIFTVTIAAQIGVVPISIFYFHQFPSLFFVANLAIIPFLPVILGLGILIIVLALLNSLPNFMVAFYGGLINFMHQIVNWVSEKEQFLFENISLGLLQMLSIYLCLTTVILWIRKPKFTRLATFLFSVLILQSCLIFQKFNNANDSFVIFHKSRYTLIGQKKNIDLKIFHNLDSTSFKNERIIKDYTIDNFIDSVSMDSIKSFYNYKDKRFLVIDSLGIYNLKKYRPDYILLRNSPKINLERVIDSLNPKYIIADGSNYKSYIERWRATCANRKISFHNTRTDGAFVIE